ncbi:MAG: efflux RND transporter periplasmic adaptor subunit [Myxococcales bacterium]|nr:efflux RND transporter periplasmic adaptor subunit [Myxococcales bacterium]
MFALAPGNRRLRQVTAGARRGALGACGFGPGWGEDRVLPLEHGSVVRLGEPGQGLDGHGPRRRVRRRPRRRSEHHQRRRGDRTTDGRTHRAGEAGQTRPPRARPRACGLRRVPDLDRQHEVRRLDRETLGGRNGSIRQEGRTAAGRVQPRARRESGGVPADHQEHRERAACGAPQRRGSTSARAVRHFQAFRQQDRGAGTSSRTITLSAPRSGYVIHKRALEGMFARTGENLFTIGDLNALWVIANVYEFDAPWVYVGQDATIEFDYMPGKVLSAKVDYVYPRSIRSRAPSRCGSSCRTRTSSSSRACSRR